uniref:putative peptidoglycan binding domain-containing protein n=1 Tax=Thermogemmatispora sp. TaxID=1968838 RepID=UPI002ACC379A
VQELLTRSGDYHGPLSGVFDEQTREAFWHFCGRENLEERWLEGKRIDRVVLTFMRERLGS